MSLLLDLNHSMQLILNAIENLGQRSGSVKIDIIRYVCVTNNLSEVEYKSRIARALTKLFRKGLVVKINGRYKIAGRSGPDDGPRCPRCSFMFDGGVRGQRRASQGVAGRKKVGARFGRVRNIPRRPKARLFGKRIGKHNRRIVKGRNTIRPAAALRYDGSLRKYINRLQSVMSKFTQTITQAINGIASPGSGIVFAPAPSTAQAVHPAPNPAPESLSDNENVVNMEDGSNDVPDGSDNLNQNAQDDIE